MLAASKLQAQCIQRPAIGRALRPAALGQWSGTGRGGVRACASSGGKEDSSKSTVAVASASSLSDEEALGLTGGAAAAAAGAAPADNAWRWEESEDAVKAYGALAGLLALGTVTPLHSTQLADLPYFIGLAVCTIYIGAHRGLTTRQRQQITLKEGILAPVLASASLFGFYLLIKYLPDFNPQVFLNAYFWMLGSFAIGGAAVPVLRQIGGPLGEKSIKFGVPEGLLLDEAGNSITQAELAPTDIVSVALALGLSSAELASGHSNFTLNNLIATLVATDILQLIGPRSFRTAGLLLLGLLVYDVFWVFGSPKVVGDNVMLTVATSDVITGPTRILFPRIPGGGSTAEPAAAAFPFSLLGLGDIAVPGLLACLALRYDASRSVDMKARAVAAAEAITSALAALDPKATSRQVADATADAACNAYDRIADQEALQRRQSLDGTNTGSVGGGGDGESAAAANRLGASLVRGVSAAASGASALGAGRSSLGASTRAAAAAATQQEEEGAAAAAAATAATSTLGDAAAAATAAATPRVPVSEAVLYQRTYFTPVMVSYVFGLALAFVANDITKLGQPALLYIVPSTLGAVLLTALTRGEVGRLWSYTDVPSFGLPSKEDLSGADGNKKKGDADKQAAENN
ncbi:hypothetical protein HYH02_007487 [Chlamydomonas schloesseri]|uniref:Uncharacterized protein n=1 Tax=Chlamydomonas schloesseri TaxID=2026947 RepID=A0A836B4Z5_9CHLO|nr:hypothetical protein HYH02_007487 [Chlamydomonas schloesseri]|eukprot:KAG2447563.1 hypothetical protein HYH02_007487 [Chlamydomonas schloesseri]